MFLAFSCLLLAPRSSRYLFSLFLSLLVPRFCFYRSYFSRSSLFTIILPFVALLSLLSMFSCLYLYFSSLSFIAHFIRSSLLVYYLFSLVVFIVRSSLTFIALFMLSYYLFFSLSLLYQSLSLFYLSLLSFLIARLLLALFFSPFLRSFLYVLPYSLFPNIWLVIITRLQRKHAIVFYMPSTYSYLSFAPRSLVSLLLYFYCSLIVTITRYSLVITFLALLSLQFYFSLSLVTMFLAFISYLYHFLYRSLLARSSLLFIVFIAHFIRSSFVLSFVHRSFHSLFSLCLSFIAHFIRSSLIFFTFLLLFIAPLSLLFASRS